MKIWLISDIDVASATYLAKFHVILEWFDRAAVNLPYTRISYEKILEEGRGRVVDLHHFEMHSSV